MKLFFYITSFLLLVSCTSRTIYKKPDDLIAKDQMIQLWTDIYIANSASNAKNKKLETKVNYMPLLKEKYNIDSARFMRSNVYYTSLIEEYEEMFESVKKNINVLKDQYDPIMAGLDPNLPISVRDSIRNARKEKREQITIDKEIE